MDGFVTDYISTLTAELGRQPTYEEYSQVMTGFTRTRTPCSAAWPADSGSAVAQVLLRLPLGDYEPPAGYGVIFRQGSVQGLV